MLNKRGLLLFIKFNKNIELGYEILFYSFCNENVFVLKHILYEKGNLVIK